MVINFLLAILNFLWYGFLEAFWFNNLPGLSVASFTSILSTFAPFLKFLNYFFPINTLLYLVMAMITSYTFLFLFRGARFIVSLFKGGIK